MIDWSLTTKIAPPIVTLFIGAALNQWLERKPRLITYYGHVSSFSVQGQQGQPNIALFTHSVVIRNTGRLAAEHVRVGHNVLPANFQIIPAVEHQVVPLPNGAAEIVLPRLVPNEEITISYLYHPPLTFDRINTNVRSDAGFAKVLHVLLTPQLSKSTIRIFWALIVVGSITCVYLVARVWIWLSHHGSSILH